MRPWRMCTIAAVSAAIAEIARFAPPPAAVDDGDEQRRGQPDVAEHEPDQAAREGDQEAPQREEREVQLGGGDRGHSLVPRQAVREVHGHGRERDHEHAHHIDDRQLVGS